MFGLLFNPNKFFDDIGRSHQLAALLMVLRWGATASFVILPLWVFRMDPFFPPIIPINAYYYHFWELLFILPYGIGLTAGLSAVNMAILKRTGRHGAEFKYVFAVTAYAFFLPWIAALLWDIVMIFTGQWSTWWIAPFHTIVLLAEGFLLAYGLRRVFGTGWGKALLIAAINVVIFAAGAFLVVR